MTRREEKIYILVIYRPRLLRLTSFFERIFIKMREYLQTHAGLKISILNSYLVIVTSDKDQNR